jgi:hypothetical protein
VAAAISVTFKWIVIYLGVRHSVLKPKLYPIVFVGTDFFSIVIQAVGGAIAATATGGNPDAKLLDVGNALLVAGVAFQGTCSLARERCDRWSSAANMTFCGGLMMIYWWRYRSAEKRGEAHKPRKASTVSETNDMNGEPVNPETSVGADIPDEVEVSPTRFRLFIYALLTAYIAVLVRCIYRCVPIRMTDVGRILIPSVYQRWRSAGVALSCRTRHCSWFSMEREFSSTCFNRYHAEPLRMIAYSVFILCALHPAFFFPILSKPKKARTGRSWLSRRSQTDIEK